VSGIVKLTIDVPEPMHRAFKAYAALRGKTMTELILRQIARWTA